MLIFLYLAGLAIAIYWVAKILGPEMSKSSSLKVTPISKSTIVPQVNESDNKIEKLESILAEKNKDIQILQTELKVFHVQLRDFDKVKILLEEEVHRLREQNRIFRSELGLPQIASYISAPEKSSTEPR